MKKYLAVFLGIFIFSQTWYEVSAEDALELSAKTAIIMEGVRYLRIEGAFYIGIGWLFLLYGLYRALGRPGMSVVLTVFSLGTRVALAYILSAIQAIGVVGIWWSIPIGWALADIVGLLYYKIRKQNLVEKEPEI